MAAAVSACLAGREGRAYDRDLLKNAFSRSGFTSGYLDGKIDGTMFGVRSEAAAELTKKTLPMLRELYRRERSRVAVGEYSVAAFHQGKPVFRDSSAGGYVLVANSRALAPEGGKQLIPGTIAAFRAG